MRHNLWMFREGDELVVCGHTYDFRENLKDLYGRWDPKRHAWIVRATRDHLEALTALGVPLHVKMRREAFCHEDPAIVWIEEGTTELHENFCGLCDSHYRDPVKVEPVEEEHTHAAFLGGPSSVGRRHVWRASSGGGGTTEAPGEGDQ